MNPQPMAEHIWFHIFSLPSSAIYIHVDDTVVIGHTAARTDMILNLIAGSLEEIGFSVSQRSLSKDMEKAVGYQHDSYRAALRLPEKNQFC